MFLLLLAVGCGGRFDLTATFSADAPAQIDPSLASLNLDIKDAFYGEVELDGQPMLFLVATSFKDACDAYSAYVPVADESYATANAASGGEEEDALLAWGAAMDAHFAPGDTVFFLSLGAASLDPSDTQRTYSTTSDPATTTVSQAQGAQPTGAFVADLFVLTEALDPLCLYDLSCTDAENEAAFDSLNNWYGADAGSITISKHRNHDTLEGTSDAHYVSRFLDSTFGVPAELGDASASFKVPYCDGLDERLFRFWAFL